MEGAEKNLWRKKLNFSEKNYGNNGKILVESSFMYGRVFYMRGSKSLESDQTDFRVKRYENPQKKQSRIDNISALEQEFLKRFCIYGGQNFLERSFKKKFNFCLRTNCPSVFSRQVKLFAGKRLRIRENISVG